jgi:plastocyanin
MKSINTSIVYLSLVIIIIAGGCKKSSPTSTDNQPPANTVNIQSFAFSPASLTVSKGTTVRWNNMDGANHTATSDLGTWDTGSIASGASKTVTFNTLGTFNYHCTVHTSMKGTIIVQ